jgi:hypothetical protein
VSHQYSLISFGDFVSTFSSLTFEAMSLFATVVILVFIQSLSLFYHHDSGTYAHSSFNIWFVSPSR